MNQFSDIRAERVDAHALRFVINRPQARAPEMAALIAAKPPLALRAAKDAVLKSSELGLNSGLAHERHCFAPLFATADFREGVAAFREKRRPSL